MVDFRNLLSTNLEAIERPKPLPAGTWNGTISARTFGESNKKKTPFVQFTISNLRPGEDIDPEDLNGVRELGKKTVTTTYYITPEAQFRIKDLIASCGHETSGRSLAEGIEDLIGSEVMFLIKHRPSEDGQEIYTDVDNVKGA